MYLCQVASQAFFTCHVHSWNGEGTPVQVELVVEGAQDGQPFCIVFESCISRRWKLEDLHEVPSWDRFVQGQELRVPIVRSVARMLDHGGKLHVQVRSKPVCGLQRMQDVFQCRVSQPSSFHVLTKERFLLQQLLSIPVVLYPFGPIVGEEDVYGLFDLQEAKDFGLSHMVGAPQSSLQLLLSKFEVSHLVVPVMVDAGESSDA
mmetsp:Transcript_4859/g.31070  ORF Transcript_4859/g.31070 Transcript_4859/m.31070 type:complete len:204 (+) Transcript_4859:2841-3452(+)